MLFILLILLYQTVKPQCISLAAVIIINYYYCYYYRFVSHKEAVEEIQYIANPVVAAKRLQDLAQGYGCKENVSVLVIQFNCNLLSSATSTSNLSTSSEGVIFHTLQRYVLLYWQL